MCHAEFLLCTQILWQEKEAALNKRAALNASHFAWQHFSPDVKRQFKKITSLGTAILPEQKLNQASMNSQYTSLMNHFYNNKSICVCNMKLPNRNHQTCYGQTLF